MISPMLTQFYRATNRRSSTPVRYGFYQTAADSPDIVGDTSSRYTPQVTISQFQGSNETDADLTREELDTLIDVAMKQHAWLLNELARR